MESYCKCRRLGQIAIPKDDFDLVLTMRWRDKERVDERSRFILPKLVNRIKELEEKYERVKMQLEQLDNSNIEQSKQEKILWMKVKVFEIVMKISTSIQRRRVAM
ncbi:hypothetical protein KY290_017215 [Solanum tuberosum]|uniref:Uncharacterized protein n=1 Tax=Solanum tuberosum TaxID=4113 RepID=A0ABQ7VAQ6_SOLTU|nr:hypothetical protein KY285_016256 [Solanum tuberosum]KAH0761142.1 hypothetical protein KY290_017215 [Solanum tuberosum]